MFWIRPYLPLFLAPWVLPFFWRQRRNWIVIIFTGLVFGLISIQQGLLLWSRYENFFYPFPSQGGLKELIVRSIDNGSLFVQTYWIEPVLSFKKNPFLAAFKNFVLPYYSDYVTLALLLLAFFREKFKKIIVVTLLIPLLYFSAFGFYSKFLYHLYPIWTFSGAVAIWRLKPKVAKYLSWGLASAIVIFYSQQSSFYLWRSFFSFPDQATHERVVSGVSISPFLDKFTLENKELKPNQFMILHHEPGIDFFNFLGKKGGPDYLEIHHFSSFFPKQMSLFQANNCAELESILVKEDLKWVLLSYEKNSFLNMDSQSGAGLLVHAVLNEHCGTWFKKIWTGENWHELYEREISRN